MENKKFYIIGIILLIILSGVIFIILTSVNYETIEITPHGTSIEVPANQTKYDGKFESLRLWNWNNGILLTYNNLEDKNLIKMTEVGYNSIIKVVQNGQKQDLDGYEAYVINADELLAIHIFDIIKVHYNGKLFCIPLSNNTTHDNILIICKDKDMAVHMAQSVKYKKVFSESNSNYPMTTVKNMTDDLQSFANDLKNYSSNLTKVKTDLKNKTGLIFVS